MTVPSNPKIYHILHFDRLSSILRDGKLFSDKSMLRHTGETGTTIGMRSIKEARLHRQVGSLSRGTVGEHVPFYFCPRSVMLYMMFIHSKELEYQGGQEPIIHLVSDFDSAISWANANSKTWTFTDRNARTSYAEFFFTKEELSKLHWDFIPQDDWRNQDVKEAKQSEFLLRDMFPWQLISEIGVHNNTMKAQVEALISREAHKPLVTVRTGWYY